LDADGGSIFNADLHGINEFDPDVVILDIRMPGGSGIDVLKTIKKKNEVPVIIMLTNYPHSQYRDKCMQNGADFFFDKSIDFKEIVKVVGGISGGGIL
jgi:two-component system response regulator DevR